MKPHTKEELLGLNKDGSTRKAQKSVHGPGYDGGPKPGFYDDMNGLLVHPHSTANMARPGEALSHTRATLGKPAKIKRSHTDAVPIHSAALTQTKTPGVLALGGDHRSAVDALTGDVVVPGSPRAVPGWGNGDVRTGHPLAEPPGSKNLKPVEPTPGMRSRTSDHRVSNIVGEMLLDAAFQASAPDDARAHGRTKRDGGM